MDLGTTTALLPNTYPAKFTFNTTSSGSCSDFVVYPTGVAPAAATIIAYTNMYGHTTCTGAAANGAPTVYWAYNTPGTLSAPTAATAGIAAANGTTGIIIDNTSTTIGESQIYYTTMSTQSCANAGTATTGNCAVQASQTAP